MVKATFLTLHFSVHAMKPTDYALCYSGGIARHEGRFCSTWDLLCNLLLKNGRICNSTITDPPPLAHYLFIYLERSLADTKFSFWVGQINGMPLVLKDANIFMADTFPDSVPKIPLPEKHHHLDSQIGGTCAVLHDKPRRHERLQHVTDSS